MIVIGQRVGSVLPAADAAGVGQTHPRGRRPLHHRGGWLTAEVYDYDDLTVGATIHGTAVIEHSDTTIVVPPGWTVRRLPNRDLELTRGGPR